MPVPLTSCSAIVYCAPAVTTYWLICADCSPVVAPLVVADARSVVPVRSESTNWSAGAARPTRFLRTVIVVAGVTVRVADEATTRPEAVTVSLEKLPAAAATTFTLIVHDAAPAARSPPTAWIVPDPAAAVTANVVPVTFAHVPPMDGVGATTSPVGSAVLKPQSVLANRSLRLVIV